TSFRNHTHPPRLTEKRYTSQGQPRCQTVSDVIKPTYGARCPLGETNVCGLEWTLRRKNGCLEAPCTREAMAAGRGDRGRVAAAGPAVTPRRTRSSAARAASPDRRGCGAGSRRRAGG